jgi:hypothetical protein
MMYGKNGNFLFNLINGRKKMQFLLMTDYWVPFIFTSDSASWTLKKSYMHTVHIYLKSNKRRTTCLQIIGNSKSSISPEILFSRNYICNVCHITPVRPRRHVRFTGTFLRFGNKSLWKYVDFWMQVACLLLDFR